MLALAFALLGAGKPDAGAPAAADAGALTGPQSFTAEAPPSVTFGEPFPYTVKVTHAKGEAYALPRNPELGDFDLVDAKKDDAAAGDQVTTTFHLQLRGWAVGTKSIPDLKLEVLSPKGSSTLTIPGPSVELVGTLPPDAGEDVPMRDIAGPVDVPVRTYRVIYGLLAFIGLVALAALLSKYLKRERPAIIAPPPPPEPAHVRARKALEQLLTEDLANQGRQRELYFRLWEIVRRYLGERFAFDAIDLTTPELLTALRVRPTPGLDLGKLARECQTADLARYAKFQPDANTCKATIDWALTMVDSTTQAAAMRAAQMPSEARPA